MGLFSCSIPSWLVLSDDLSTTNTRASWLCLALFYRRQYHLYAFTGHYPIASRFTLHAPRYCLPPTAELRKIEWARSGRADPLSYYAPNQAIPAENPILSHSLAAVHLLNILSWPEALDATGSRRACRRPSAAMPVLSLISPSSPKELGVVSPELPCPRNFVGLVMLVPLVSQPGRSTPSPVPGQVMMGSLALYGFAKVGAWWYHG